MKRIQNKRIKNKAPIPINYLTALNLNIRSLVNKTQEFLVEIYKLNQPDLLTLTELWFRNKIPIPLPGYSCTDFFARDHSRGGGAAIYVKKGALFSICQELKDLSVEGIIEISAINLRSIASCPLTKPIIIASIYRPTENSCQSFETFFDRFEIILTKLFRKKYKFLVSGDFNFNFLDTTDYNVRRFDNLLSSVNCTRAFLTEPTRITKNSRTLLDNCITNIEYNSAVTLDPGLSDHAGQLLKLKILNKNSPQESSYILKRNWSTNNKLALISHITHFATNLADSRPERPVSSKFKDFNDGILKLMDLCCPLTKTKPTKKTQTVNCNSDTSKLSEERKHFYLLYKLTGQKSFKKASNKANKKLRKAIYSHKREMYDNELRKSTNKSKTVWSIIKTETQDNGEPLIDCIVYENREIKNPSEIANAFNKYFTSLTNNLPTKLDEGKALELLHQNVPSPTSKFSFSTIDLTQLNEVIKDLNLSKSDKNGDIPSFIFKEHFPIIGPVLLNLINGCIANNIFPDVLKTAKVIPIYKKKGDRKSINNYRPISILPSLSKILERVLYNQLIKFFELGNHLHHHQFGFRKNKSTTHALQKLTEKIYQALEKGVPVASLHFDLTKAFDLIDHKLLIAKLKYYLNDEAADLLASYLSNRKQIVKLNSMSGIILSDICDLETGVPQGSILGPLLFIIFINDLPGAVEFLTLLFADDTTALIPGFNFSEDSMSANHQVTSWCEVNGLIINQLKNQIIRFKPSNRSDPPHEETSMTNNLLLTTEAKSLGITLDSNLSWKPHVSNLVAKLNSIKWALRNISRIMSLDSCLIYYHANVLSHLRYGLVVWGLNNCSGQLFIEQKKILRIMFNKPPNFSCKELFIEHHLFTLPSLFILDALKYAINNGLISPAAIRNDRNPFIQQQLTRLKVAEQDVTHIASIIFNKLPLALRKTLKKGEISAFLIGLKNFLLLNAFYSLKEFLE